MVAQTRYVGTYLRWPVALIVGFMAVSAWRRGGSLNSVFQMKTLMQHNVKVIPHMAPVAWRDLDQEPVDSGPWRVGRQPLQWAVENELLVDGKGKPLKRTLFLNKVGIANLRSPLLKPDKNKEVNFDRDKALTLAKRHLGERFSGFASLPVHQQGLAAAFATFGAGDKKAAFALLDQMSLSFVEQGRNKDNPGKADPAQEMELDITGAAELFAKYGQDEELLYHTANHAIFVNTWFHALIEYARIKGVLECSRFIWLKPTDRLLWYVLNQVGRRSGWSESAGERAHYLAETALDQCIEDPEVTEAVNALQEALLAEGWLPSGGRRQ